MVFFYLHLLLKNLNIFDHFNEQFLKKHQSYLDGVYQENIKRKICTIYFCMCFNMTDIT